MSSQTAPLPSSQKHSTLVSSQTYLTPVSTDIPPVQTATNDTDRPNDQTNNVPKQSIDTDDAAAAWGRCAEILHDNDKSLLQGWKEEIDTLLVFAGLFSAVLTAFNAQSYQLLQPDTGDASVALLMQISMQLNSFTVNPSFINSTHPASLNVQSTFTAPAYAVRINTLWFASLVFSLASASIGISVKQWLNQYSHEVIGYPRSHENARLRQYRYESLVKWRVLAILPLIPLLLQISLALFLVGLVDLLWNIHHAVAAVVTVFVAMLLLFSTFTIVLPSFTCDCFYKSPQALGFFLLVQQMLRMWRALCHVMLSVLYPNGVPNSLPQTDKWLLSASMRHIYYSWREQERESVRKLEPVLDSHILTTCDAIKMDDDFLEKTIEPCFRTLDVAVAASCYDDILRHRAEDLEQLHQTWTSSRGVKSVNATLSLTLCALDKLSIGGQQYREDKLRISALLIYIWRWIGSLSLQYPVMARLWIVVADMSADERSLRVMLPFWKFFMCNHDLVPVASDVLPPLNSFISSALKHRDYDNTVLDLCLAGLKIVISENLPSRDDGEIYNQTQQIVSSLRECLRVMRLRSHARRRRFIFFPDDMKDIQGTIMRIAQIFPDLAPALSDLTAVLRETMNAKLAELDDGSLGRLDRYFGINRDPCIFHELSTLETVLNPGAQSQIPGSEGGECVDSSALPDQETEMKSSGPFEGYEASPSPGLPSSPQLQQRTPARFETSSSGGGVAGS